jgi:Cyclic nucleotide-binding domain
VLTPVERVLILRSADMLKDVGPRHLLGLANVAREVEMVEGDRIYAEDDPADALYIVVEGKVRLSTGDRTMSEVGPGEAFGTWSLVDDTARGHRAECIEAGLTLALHRDEFYDIAAGDLTLLSELVRVLAKRLRALAAERPPEDSRVEGEGIEPPEATATPAQPGEVPSTAGAALAAAATGKEIPEPAAAELPEEPVAPVADLPLPEPIVPPVTPPLEPPATR